MRHLFIILLCLPLQLNAEWINFVVNYPRNEYNAGSQNWKITQQWNGKMYFANKAGVLEYTGDKWKLYQLSNESETRSVFKSANNILYVGGINEFGCLEPDVNGELRYHNLSASLSRENLAFGNVWDIYEIGGSMFFIGDGQVVKYRDSVCSFIDCPYKIDCSFMLDETLYVGTSSGIYVLSGNKFIKYPNSDALDNKKFKSINKAGDRLIVATSKDLYTLDDKVSRFYTEADKFIAENELFSIAVNDKYIAAGTVLNGIVLLDHSGKVIKYINESHGLQNNTILSLFFDKEDNLWVGLDNGIAYISLNNAITELYRSPISYGAGYSAALFDNKLYLATNRGLYFTAYPVPVTEYAPTLALVPGMQGQVWDINVIDNKLFCSSDKGLFVIESGKPEKIHGINNNWTCRKMLRDTEKYWLPSYSGFYTMDAKTFEINRIEGFSNPLINFEEDKEGKIWAKNGNRELIIFTFNDSINRLLSSKIYDCEHGLPVNAKCCKYDDNIILCSSHGNYKLVNDSFVNVAIEGLPADCILATECANKIWFTRTSELGVYDRNTLKTVSYPHNLPLMTNFERIKPLNDSLVIIMNENGFALWNSNYVQQDTVLNLQILDVTVVKRKDSVVYVNNTSAKSLLEIPYENNSLVFHYRLNSYNPALSPVYRYKLDNEEWFESSLRIKAYSDIPAGKHVFYVECLSYSGRKLTDEFHFVILSPWYSTMYAYIIYTVLAILMLLGLNHIDNSRLKRKHKQLETVKQREIQNKELKFKAETEAKELQFMQEKQEKEREIIRLKNEHLELEIKHKSQELATITINFVRKNEILMEIRQSITRYSDELKNIETAIGVRRSLIRLASKISENMEQDDSLKRFEEHFDVVHNNFIKRLLEKYPDLSLNERKMCAFIKMNLSTKEIVPLINLSMRGVESVRFRLRKKFGLKRTQGLIKFLNGI
jgi:hypothetical protein